MANLANQSVNPGVAAKAGLTLVRSHTTLRLDLVNGPVLANQPIGVMPPMLGAYRVLSLLARGGMGGVYLGEHETTKQRVALKLLAPRWVEHEPIVQRLLEEFEVSRRVGHAGLLQILAAERTADGTPYLVMELLDGENLGDLLDRGAIEPGAVAAIGAQIADAVAAMHEAGIVHCDLKPENVMLLYKDGLAGWPRTKVLDFGVARMAPDVTTEIAGTPGYMAPEQWRGTAEARSDVYALGCTLYQLLTGAAPFEGSIPSLMQSHCDRLPAPPSSRRAVPEMLDRMIMRMLAKDARMRPRMAEVARMLADLAYAMPPGARNDSIRLAISQ
ncbi:MAG: serine/threonine protein kinase [Deltaproteobacteria bacterium]|nr:serine/threonine protein kinase [Deltaproteobacteria bacterium]